jgi:hypothetical protein
MGEQRKRKKDRRDKMWENEREEIRKKNTLKLFIDLL